MISAAIDPEKKSGRWPKKAFGVVLLAGVPNVGVMAAAILGMSVYLNEGHYVRDFVWALILGVCVLSIWVGLRWLTNDGSRLRDKRNLSILGGVAILPNLLVASCGQWLIIVGFIMSMGDCADNGRQYMDSLKAPDIQAWIERSKILLAQYSDSQINARIDGKDIPPDLRKLKIIAIYINESEVCYLWLGGIDHTELRVEQMDDGTFQVTAQYLDDESKVIWPKPVDVK